MNARRHRLNEHRALLKHLKAAGLENVGQFSDYTASERRLNDIDGVGSATVQKIEDRMLDFWKDNPQESEDVEA